MRLVAQQRQRGDLLVKDGRDDVFAVQGLKVYQGSDLQ